MQVPSRRQDSLTSLVASPAMTVLDGIVDRLFDDELEILEARQSSILKALEEIVNLCLGLVALLRGYPGSSAPPSPCSPTSRTTTVTSSRGESPADELGQLLLDQYR